MSGKRIAVLMGGNTPERSVSLKGSKEVIKALKSLNYKVFPMDTGRISGKELVGRLINEKIDAAFILLHGPVGEDGTIQGFLDVLGIPYTGSKVLSSAIGMNKEFTKAILVQNKILTPKYQVLASGEKIKIRLTYPIVVKPTCQGSTIGISVVPNRADLDSALKIAFKYGSKILIEEYINGKEITVGIISKDGSPKTLPVIEIIPKGKFYDYKSKYIPGESQHIIPAKITKETESKAGKVALKVYKLLSCVDFARVDMIVSQDNRIYVLEINTIPGFTKTSLVPEAAKYAGISFKELISKTVEACLYAKN